MMRLMESLFDIAYLGIVIGLGIRLLLESKKGAKRFGIMAILLGLGDGFHLIPRVVSHLTLNGFEKNIVALSWGEFVTSITMTIFYILFYHFYQDISGEKNKNKTFAIYLLALVRIVLVLLPQNLWGSGGDYTFALIRNVPFLIMGLLLVVWTYSNKQKTILKKASLFIFLSFLFYIPVVVGTKYVSVLGALMIPKTVMYIAIVLLGYKYFVNNLEKENVLKLSVSFLLLGLSGGVFYREFVKFYNWQSITSLSLVHVHLLTLGFLALLILYALVQVLDINLKAIQKPTILYIIGLAWVAVTFMIKGIYVITSQRVELFSNAAFSGISGLGHITIAVGLVWTMICIIDGAKTKTEIQK